MTSKTDQNDNQEKVGFEIEFIGLTIEKTAHLIAKVFDGKITKIHKDAIQVDTHWGSFKVEVDAQLLEILSKESSKNIKQDKLDLQGMARDALAPLLQTFVPNEIVCPPIPQNHIPQFEPLVDALRTAGAKGTSASLSYAFGLHINPEIKHFDAQIIHAYLKAFVLLYDWMRQDMMIDKTRMITMFAKGYPGSYCEHLLQLDYQPNLEQLIQDYLQHIPSRNYALDCYPLFMYLEEDLIKSKLKDPLIKARPTFHFRMPNCSIDDSEWTLNSQWRYWQLIKNLACQENLLDDMSKEYLAHKDSWLNILSKKWEKKIIREYLPQL